MIAMRKNITSGQGIRYAMLMLCLMAANILTAQQGTSDQVVITREYDAKVKEADKISLAPTIPEEEDKTKKLTYSVPPRDFKDIPFEPNPLKPLGMSADKLERFNSSYIKLGFGSQLTPLVELMYNDNKSKNIKFGFQYDHLSQYGFHITNQKYSDDKIGAYVKYFVSKLELAAGFGFHNLRTHFYGSPDTVYDGKAILQNLRDYDLNLGLRNIARNKSNIDYSAALRASYFQETSGGSNEWFINGKIGADYMVIKNHSLFAGFQFDASQCTSTGQSLLRDLFLTNVGYRYYDDDWKVKAAFTLGVDNGKVYGLPDLSIEKRLYEHKLIAYGGWEIRFQKNSFKSLSERNNFVNSDILLKNTRVGDLYGGLKGTIEKFSYNLRFGYRNISDMAFYYNDYFDPKRFYVSYDPKVADFNAVVELGYNYKDVFRLLFSTDINSYSPRDNDHAWYEPALKSSLKASYNIQKKIIVGMDIFGFSDYYGFISPSNIKAIKGTADIGLNVEYIFNKRLSFFGKLNNIAHQRYEAWANYPVYGINGLIGAKFCF